jgi:hypothetical protein
MKRTNVYRTIVMVVGGITALMALWALDGGATVTITFEEAVISLLMAILVVLVLNGSDR